MSQDNYALAKFGIDGIYIRENFTYSLLDKLQQRAVLTLDADDNIAAKYTSHDMVLIFYKEVPNHSLLYRFLKFLSQDAKKESFIESHTLLDEEELFPAIKSKKFVLITHRVLAKEIHTPA
jgi:hypothetical protein